jgi:hypothetical protein
MPGAAAADDGPECGRTSRHSDDAPPGPPCAEDAAGVDGAADAGGVAVSRDDGAVEDAALEDAALDDAAVDDAVKDGRRSPGEKTEGPGVLEPEPDGGGAMIEPPGTAGAACLGAAAPAVAASSESEASLFPDGLNQLVVAATACLTADARPSE